MTQAFNLSQLANNLDSSGRLDATDGLVNAVPIANGGTGASTDSAARANLNVPTRTGGDASGTWGINISGNAATATNATNATNATTAANGGVTSVNGNTGAVTVSLVPSSFNAIGSLLVAHNYSTTNLNIGDTIAGASLLYATGYTADTTNVLQILEGTVASGVFVAVGGGNASFSGLSIISGRRSGNIGAFQPSNTATLTGTWRVLFPAMARNSSYDSDSDTTSIFYRAVLVQRIS